VGFAELERREALRIGAGIDQTLVPGHDIDDPRVLERQLAVQQLGVIVRTQLAQQRFEQQQPARERPVADALGHRRDAGGGALLDHVGETGLGQLERGRYVDADLLDQVLVVIELDRIGLDRQAVELAVHGPGRLGPVLDTGRIDIGVERLQEAAGHELRLVGLHVEDVGGLAGPHRRFGLGIDVGLRDEVELDRALLVGGLEVMDARGHPFLLGRLVRPVAPPRDLRRVRRAGGTRHGCDRCDQYGQSAETLQAHLTLPRFIFIG
jgi:hypothetical protein